jgi:WD40 repeat protein
MKLRCWLFFVFAVLSFFCNDRKCHADQTVTNVAVGYPSSVPATPSLVMQVGHTRDVSSVAFSPDGKLALSGSKDNTLKLWDVQTGKEIRTFNGHDREVESVAFSPDGKFILSGGGDGTLRLWDVQTGKEIKTFNGHYKILTSVAFSTDGKRVLSGLEGHGEESTIIIWDIQTGREIKAFKVPTKVFRSIAFSPNEKFALLADESNTLKCWDIQTGVEINKFSGHSGVIHSVALSQDGKFALSGSEDHTLKLWDVQTGKEIRTFNGHSEAVNSVAFSPDGKLAFSGSGDGTLKLWDVQTGKEITTFNGHDREVSSVAFSPDGKFAISGGRDRVINIWNIPEKAIKNAIQRHSLRVNSITFSPDGKMTLLGNSNGTLNFWDNLSGALRNTIKSDSGAVVSVAYSPDGKLALSGGRDHILKLWDVQTGKELKIFNGHSDTIFSVAFSPDGKRVLSGSLDGTVRLWDVSTGKTIKAFGNTKDTALVDSVAFSQDGKFILSGIEGTFKWWDAQTAAEVKVVEHSFQYVQTSTGVEIVERPASEEFFLVAFNSNGKRILQTGVQLKFAPQDHHNPPIPVVISQDGNFAVVGGKNLKDSCFHLLELQQGKEIQKFTDCISSIITIAINPDGKHIISGHSDNTIMIWDIASGKWLAKLVSFDDGGWAVIDQEGRYDSSSNGQVPYLHWVVGNTPISLDQLKDRYYEPGLLAKIMGFNKEPLRPVPNIADALVKLFPEVNTQIPPEHSNRLDITLTDQGGGIGPVRVRVNGKEVVEDARNGKKLSGKTAKLSVDIDPNYLLPGENQIEVLAWNADKLLRSWPSRLTMNGAQARGVIRGPDGEAINTSKAPLPITLHAIVVGTSNYADPSLKLAFSGKDAADFAQALDLGAERLFGANKVKMHLFTDYENKGHLPSRAALEEAFRQVAKDAVASDILVVYLSGHGVMSSGDDGDYYYLTREAQGLNLADPAVRKLWGISGSELTDWVKDIKAAKQVMVLDTCAAGGAAEKITTSRAITRGQILALDRLQERTGFHVLAGAAADKKSLESSRYNQGILTYALLAGMKGAALRDGEFVDVATLFNYAADQVPQLAKNIGGIQSPRVMTAKGSTFDIGQLTNEDKKQMSPLTMAMPMMLRASFQDEDQLHDHLKLTHRFNQRLAGEKYAASRGALVFMDEDEFPDAWRISGRYEKAGTGWKLKAKLFQGDVVQGLPLLLELPTDPDKQVEVLYDAVIRKIGENKK